ncbi:uncharacterized protein BT62DRAFT_76186 [Guyanagaster necrorhizus]|uniref:Uncharacterized protein n=1 Tax=Guyanagaster necrorhizus TaxID=856835 RepID=A0A9P7VTX5_9AGAR|nr:uncharacterized protein BT62DRAFT_76186 [Guyanagaster necrorhizus MCA 3950]KAG7447328.1 hypothetical protein BT62DRAFT_76186 [Guyanagaster necrorhizus MCA 3950]
MRCWGISNPGVAAENVMKTGLKDEKVRMRIKSVQEAQLKLFTNHQGVQVEKISQVNKAPRAKRSEQALDQDKAKWEEERALVRDSAVIRSSALFGGHVLEAGHSQELQSEPSTSTSGKEKILDENRVWTQRIVDWSSADVQTQDIPTDLTSNVTLPGIDRAVCIDEGFNSFSPTSHPSSQDFRSDLVLTYPSPSELVCNAEDSSLCSDNIHPSNNPRENTHLGKRTSETAFGADTIHERDASLYSLPHPLLTAELLHVRTGIQHKNIGEDSSWHSVEFESTGGDPLDAFSSLKKTFTDIIRESKADNTDLITELEVVKMHCKKLEESEAHYKQEDSQLKADKLQLEENLKKSLLKAAEADERLKLVHRIIEKTRRDWQIPMT